MPSRDIEVYSGGEDYISTDEDNYTEEWLESDEDDTLFAKLEYRAGPPASFVVLPPQHKARVCNSFQEFWETLSLLAKENISTLKWSTEQ